MAMSTLQAVLLLKIIRLHHAAMKRVLLDTQEAPDLSLTVLVMLSCYLSIALT